MIGISAVKTMQADTEDHRVRVAREKRQRMRARLLAATMEVCSVRNGVESVVIDDVIKVADVSRGTFYKHFTSLEHAFSELGSQLADETVQGLRAMFAGDNDPVYRTACGLQLMMIHAIVDPVWAGFVVHTDHLKFDSILAEAIRENAVNGRDQGHFKFNSLEAATNILFGSTREGVWQMLHSDCDRQVYISDVIVMNLLALGVPRAKAIRIAQKADQDIAARGPTSLPWWKYYR